MTWKLHAYDTGEAAFELRELMQNLNEKWTETKAVQMVALRRPVRALNIFNGIEIFNGMENQLFHFLFNSYYVPLV